MVEPHDKPLLIVLLLCLLQAGLWTLVPALVHSAPPLDVVESALWGREWVWATYKHPSFPGWIIEIGRMLTGSAHWPAYLASQIAVIVTYLVVFALGRDMFAGEEHASRLALAAVLLSSTLYYVSLPTPEWNHNVPQMPLYALVIFFLWRATSATPGQGTGRWHGLASWLALGLFSGIGMHVKYSFGILLVVAALWIVLQKRGRLLATPGPWLGLAVFLVVTAPQIIWLLRNDLLPLAYARARASGASVSQPFTFLLAQLADHGAMLALAAIAGLIVFRRPRWSGLVGRREVRFLLLLGLGPALFLAALALFAGFGLKTMWGLPMFSLSGLIIVALGRDRLTATALRRLMIGAFLVVVALPLGHGVFVLLGDRVSARPLRVQWPQAAIAESLRAAWSKETAAPLRIVAGGEWLAGLVALQDPDLPSIMTRGDLRLSPWITPRRLAREGVLIVWQDRGHGPPAWARQLAGDRPFRALRFAWPGFPQLPPLTVRYAVVPPQAAGARRPPPPRPIG